MIKLRDILSESKTSNMMKISVNTDMTLGYHCK